MTSRRNFLKDIALGIAISLVPKILQPIDPEILLRKAVTGTAYYDSDTSYITKQIARYNKRFIKELDERIFQILAVKIS